MLQNAQMRHVSRAWRRAHAAAVHEWKLLLQIIPAGLRYSLAMHESVMHEQKLSSLLSDRHEMAYCGLDAHATHTWTMRNEAFVQIWGSVSNARPEDPDKLAVPR